jgi:hypothetical protein
MNKAPLYITHDVFLEKTGHVPQDDDLERCNCLKAGEPLHEFCGWCEECDQPKFMCTCAIYRKPTTIHTSRVLPVWERSSKTSYDLYYVVAKSGPGQPYPNVCVLPIQQTRTIEILFEKGLSLSEDVAQVIRSRLEEFGGLVMNQENYHAILHSIIDCFIDLYNKQIIYRNFRDEWECKKKEISK